MHKENDYLFIPQLNDQYTYINKKKKKKMHIFSIFENDLQYSFRCNIVSR